MLADPPRRCWIDILEHVSPPGNDASEENEHERRQ
jgi:hypothetical protein